MLVTDAIQEIRNKTNDRDKVGLDDSELLSYLNEAIQYISAALIGYESTYMVKDLNITTTSTSLPDNFVRLCGYYPIKRNGTTISLLDDPPLKIRYFASYPLATDDEDEEMPFHNVALSQVAIKIACLYANAQQKLDISTDQALEQELAQLIAKAMGAGE